MSNFIDLERHRPDFERLANKNAACGLKRSRRGTYVNPAIARDWKWFQMGVISSAVVESAPPELPRARMTA